MNEHLARADTASGALRRALITVVAFSAVSAAFAGNFGVAPIRIDFDRGVRTGSVTVTNDDEAQPLRAQVDARSWTQDADGKDRYEQTGELSFLPVIMSVPAGQRQLVRIGIRVPAAEREKAYRLFIEEIPEPRKQGDSGAQVAVKVRFGVPVFVKPLKEEPKGEIEQLEVTNRTLKVTVRNTGNVHFAITSVQLKAGDLFSKEISGWYLLPGASRVHSAEIPAELCPKLGAIDVVVKTDRLDLARRVELSQVACQ